MNADHSDATLAIVQDVAKIKVDKANILTLDRLGMAVRCEQKGESFRARIPFSRQVVNSYLQIPWCDVVCSGKEGLESM